MEHADSRKVYPTLGIPITVGFLRIYQLGSPYVFDVSSPSWVDGQQREDHDDTYNR